MARRTIGCLFLLFAIATAGLLISPPPLNAVEPVVVGVMHAETFPYAAMMKNSYEMALSDITRENGINGNPLSLAYANDQGDPVIGKMEVKRLIEEEGAVLLVGAYQSSNALQMARVADELNTPFLICTAADDRITQRELANVFRLNPPAREYAKGLETLFINKIKPKSMGILYENSPYGTSSALKMMWFCRENDIVIKQIMPYHKERTTDAYYQKLIAPFKDDPPDVIYMVSYLKDAVGLVRKMKSYKINSLLCGGAGGFTHTQFIARAGHFADKLLTATPWFPHAAAPKAKQYYLRYKTTHGTAPDYHGAEAFSALLVAADALRRANTLEADSVRLALKQTNLETPFGPVKFTSYENFERQNKVDTMVLQVVGNAFQCIWPAHLSGTHFAPPPEWRQQR